MLTATVSAGLGKEVGTGAVARKEKATSVVRLSINLGEIYIRLGNGHSLVSERISPRHKEFKGTILGPESFSAKQKPSHKRFPFGQRERAHYYDSSRETKVNPVSLMRTISLTYRQTLPQN